MHPDDEAEFVEQVTREPDTVFIDGPKWPTPRPPVVSDLSQVGSFLMIWNRREVPRLYARRYDFDGAHYWSYSGRHAVQFLRSRFEPGKPCLLAGRIAVGTPAEGSAARKPPDALVDARYVALRKYIRRTYVSRVLRWQDATTARSANNPLPPDAHLWVGPCALRWLQEDVRARWVGLEQYIPRAYLIDLVFGADIAQN